MQKNSCLTGWILLALFGLFSFGWELHAETATPIALSERPDYLVESPDVILVEFKSTTVKPEHLDQIEGNHLLDQDGYISFGSYGRVMLQSQTTDECAEAIHFHLAKALNSEDFQINVKVHASNSKEYHVVFLSPIVGEQRLVFPFSGHETVLDAVERLNAEDSVEIPEGVNNRVFVIRTAKPGKPAEFLAIDFEAALKASEDHVEAPESGKTDISLQAGDTVLMTIDFSDEEETASDATVMRPDAPVLGVLPAVAVNRVASTVEGDAADRLAELLALGHNHIAPPDAVIEDIPYSKTAGQFESQPKKDLKDPNSKDTVFRTLFIKADRFHVSQNLIEDFRIFCSELKVNMSVTGLPQTEPQGLWLIIGGEEAKVQLFHQELLKITAENKE